MEFPINSSKRRRGGCLVIYSHQLTMESFKKKNGLSMGQKYLSVRPIDMHLSQVHSTLHSYK